MSPDRGEFLRKTLGPGLLFAGAAVGVSHLVQSTRAGAVYGLSLIVVVIAANVFKYPAFSFGPRYAAATGTSLLEGYRRQGRWALALYAVLTFGTMFAVQAVVTVVTAGLAKSLFELDTNIVTLSGGLIIVCAGLLIAGRYRALDIAMKISVGILTVATIVATILAVPKMDWSGLTLWPTTWDAKTAAFVAPLAGWMPSAVDISVWHSLWTLAKRRDTKHAPTVKQSMLDFDIGYYGTAFLAICFLFLGAAVMQGKPIPATAGGFAASVIGLYTETLGEWSRWLIGGSALLVMFSTTLAVTDGFPRALAALYERFFEAETPGADRESRRARIVYWIAMGAIATGAVIVLQYVKGKDFKWLIDVATALAFLTAPMLATLNHRAVFGPEMPDDARPSQTMRVFSLICIVVLAVFALWWLTIRF
jgi:Mn2+/Fe2+ NRAMP family transporter